MTKNISIIMVFLLALLSSAVLGQTYKFKIFDQTSGLNNNFINAITQDSKGYLWVGTSDGLTSYNGTKITNYTIENGLADNYVSFIFNNPDGSLWIGHNQGDITVFNYNKFSPIETGLENMIVGICINKNGTIWACSQSGEIVSISKDRKIRYYQFEKPNSIISSIDILDEKYLLVATREGLFSYEIENFKLIKSNEIIELKNKNINALVCSKKNGSLWIACADNGIYKLILRNDNQSLIKIECPIPVENIQNIYEDKQGNLWVSTFGNGLYKLVWSVSQNKFIKTVNFNHLSGLPGDYVKVIYEDREKNIWIGTYGSGLAQRLQESFLFFTVGNDDQTNNVKSIFIDSAYLWVGTNRGMFVMDKISGQIIERHSIEEGFVNDIVTVIKRKSNIELWVGTSNSGLYIFNELNKTFTPFILPGDALSKAINYLEILKDSVWIATDGGLHKYYPDTNISFTIADGLPHNVITHLYHDGEKLYIATLTNTLPWLSSNNINTRLINNRSDLFEINSITKDKKGRIWLATSSSGILCLNDSTTTQYTTVNGLKSDYCYSILSDSDNNIWISHQGGISKYFTSEKSFKTYGKNEGITASFNKNAQIIDEFGSIWFGSTEGLIKYVPENDIYQVAPLPDLIKLIINNEIQNLSNEISLSYGSYNIEFYFIGVSLRSPDKVKYKYKLEGLDNDYFETSKNSVAYNNLSEGKYILKVYSGIDGKWTEKPKVITIIINGPFWKKWWVISLFFISIFLIIYLIIISRFRNLKRREVILEKELQIRTAEILVKNEELKHKNQNITDSLLYAQSLQLAILPDEKFTKTIFPDSFVIYKPKDIVSGDFFRIDKIPRKNKVLVACADCTGHGVPAAFMSMIGITIIKDIISTADYNSVSGILHQLNSSVLKILGRNIEDRRNEGMDIVMCEIDFDKKIVTFSSALRPIVFVSNGQLNWIKGSRFSIGGHANTKKVFDEVTFSFSPGDMIYMFSDGFVDQFGGPKSKKFKTGNFKKLLGDYQHLPMEEQGKVIEDIFNKWVEKPNKDITAQVDDILVIGIKIPDFSFSEQEE